MKRASYREAVEIIAFNDEPTVRDVAAVEAYTTVQLIADIFGKQAVDVARDVVRYREKYDI